MLLEQQANNCLFCPTIWYLGSVVREHWAIVLLDMVLDGANQWFSAGGQGCLEKQLWHLQRDKQKVKDPFPPYEDLKHSSPRVRERWFKEEKWKPLR